MPLYDHRCPEGHVTEHFHPSDVDTVKCPVCDLEAPRVYLTLAKPNWLALAQGSSASPEAIDRFEKMHKQQADKEAKSLENHGDYGPRPGA